MKDDNIPQLPATLLAIIGFGCTLLSLGGTLAAMGAASLPLLPHLA